MRQWLTVVSMVGRGMGVAIVPQCLATTGIAGALFRPVSGVTAVSTIQCMWSNDQQSPIVGRLVEYARRHFVPPGAVGSSGVARRPADAGELGHR